MCTPWTRRDWATCFLACKFPLVPKGSTVVFDSANDGTKKKKKSPRKVDKERVNQTQRSLRIDRGHDTGWFPIEDEDYIVFCIEKDGAIRVKDRSRKALSPASRDDRKRSVERSARRRVNFDKVMDGKFAEEVHDTTTDCVMNRGAKDVPSTNEASSIINDEKGKGICSISSETDGSSESYNQSSEDSSRSSFAFPVLNQEGVSSPARMPKPDFLQFRTNQPGVTCPHCCRFH